MTPKAWSESVDGTWLGKKARRDRIQHKVDQLLKGWKGTAAFPRFDEFREQLVLSGQHGAWHSCTVTIAIAGELLLCAESGGTIKSGFIVKEAEHAHATEAIRHLRNAVCHPAHVSPSHSGPLHVAQLCDWLNAHALAPPSKVTKLRANHGVIAERWVAETAIECLHVTAQAFEARHLG